VEKIGKVTFLEIIVEGTIKKRGVSRIARHSVVNEEADMGILLENLMERLELKTDHLADVLETEPSVYT